MDLVYGLSKRGNYIYDFLVNIQIKNICLEIHRVEGCYLSMLGLNESTMKNCIQEQKKYDNALYKLSIRESEIQR